MDYADWLHAVDKALRARRAGFNASDLDRAALAAAFQRGDSPVVFASTAGRYRLTPAQLQAQAHADAYAADTGMGACPQCGSRNLAQQTVRDSNPGGCVLLGLLAVCCFPIALLGIPFIAHDKLVGVSRSCRACGHAWKIS